MDITLLSHAWTCLHTHGGNIEALFKSAPRIPRHVLADITRCWRWSKLKRNTPLVAGRNPATIFELWKSCS